MVLFTVAKQAIVLLERVLWLPDIVVITIPLILIQQAWSRADSAEVNVKRGELILDFRIR